jgi:alcohol dehydrogenase class IV
MAAFDFVSAGRIVFGAGRAANEIGDITRGFGERCLLVRGRSEGASRVVESLRAAGLSVVEMAGPRGEPDEADVDAAVPIARDARPDVIVAVGGGSVIDFAKGRSHAHPQTRPTRPFATIWKASGAG